MPGSLVVTRKVGVAALVVPSVLLLPLSLAGLRRGAGMTGGVVSTVTCVAGESAEGVPPPGVCRAVMAWAPSASAVEPSVVTVVVAPVAVAEPISVPSA